MKQTVTVDGGSPVVTEFLVDPQNPMGYAQTVEEHVDGTLDKTYTLGLDVITQAAVGEILHLLYDSHGSTRLLVDESGNVALDGSVPQVFTSNAYGHLIGFTGTPLTNYLRAGEYRDFNTSWDYLRARWERDGRFNRMDPFAGVLTSPLSFHEYLFVHGDPRNGHDPLGLSPLTNVTTAISISAVSANIVLTAVAGVRNELSIQAIGINIAHNLALFGVAAGALMLSGPVAIAAAGTLALSSAVGIYNLVEEWPRMDAVDRAIAFGEMATFAIFAGSIRARVSASAPSGVPKSTALDWKAVVKTSTGETRVQHVRLHNVNNTAKPLHGVFNGDGVTIANAAWNARGNVRPTLRANGLDTYVIRYKNAGWEGGAHGTGAILNHVTFLMRAGTNELITAYPSQGLPASFYGAAFLPQTGEDD